MMFDLRATISKVDNAAVLRLTSDPKGPVGSDLRRRGKKLLALSKASAPKDTGRLARSMYVRYIGGRNPSVVVGSTVSYAYDVHEGTRPHRISPDRARVLRFKHRGRVIYAREVYHPGTPATKFISRHLRKVV